MNTKQLTYVLTLAKYGSFSKAADELGITQPSLSQYIKKIEDEAGVSLFERTGGFVRMTDAGKVYAETGKKILELERDMQNRFSDISGNRSGTLVIGISAHRSVSLMPSIVGDFKSRYPGVCVVLKEYPRDELIERAEHGEFDLCITTPPVSEKMFEIRAAFREEILLAAPAGGGLCAKLSSHYPSGTVDISSLIGCDFVMLNEEHPMQVELQETCDSFGLRLNKTVECSSLEALISMVKEGMGASLVPACLRSLGGTDISFFHIAQPIPRREIILVRRRNRYVPDKVSDMIDTINDKLSQFFYKEE